MAWCNTQGNAVDFAAIEIANGRLGPLGEILAHNPILTGTRRIVVGIHKLYPPHLAHQAQNIHEWNRFGNIGKYNDIGGHEWVRTALALMGMTVGER